jgi:alpha-1,2-mannosyltransferase
VTDTLPRIEFPKVVLPTDRPVAKRALLSVPIAVALVLRVLQLSRPGYLFGITEYDDGVYATEAMQFVHGMMPYRDFPMVHPPGILLLMAPIAALQHQLGSAGVLALCRVVTLIVDVVNVVLVGRVLRHRGLAAQFVGMTLMAVFPACLVGSHTLLLEPYLNLFTLLAVLVGFREGSFGGPARAFACGCLFGLAAMVKIFAVPPAAVLLAVLLFRHRSRAVSLLSGAVLSVLTVTLPFLVQAPGAFLRESIVDQVVRSSMTRTPLWPRVDELDGLSLFGGGVPVIVALAVAAAIGSGLVFVVVRSRRAERRWDDLTAFALPSLIVGLGALLWAATMWFHYADFLAPYAAIVLGVMTPAAVGTVGRSRWVTWGLVVTATGAVVAEAFVIGGYQGSPPATALKQLIPPGACVFSDQVSTTVAAGVWHPLAGCPPIVDSDGATLSWDGGVEPQTLVDQGRAAAETARWESVLSRADYLVLTSKVGTLPMTPSLWNFIHENFRPVATLPIGEGTLWRAVSPPSRAAEVRQPLAETSQTGS